MTGTSRGVERRSVLAGAGVLALSAGRAAAAPRHDATVGEGGYPSVQAALDAAPEAGGRPWRILVKSGRWYEKLTIDKPNIHLIGEDRHASVLDFDAAAGLPSPDGTPWGTSRSSSVTITAPDCALKNLTVRNSFDYVGARADPENNPAGNGLQAVALAFSRQADRTLIEDVDMESWQDTLLTNAGRSYFSNCRISGAVDYIFGAGTAYFDRCDIVTLDRPGMSGARQGYVTAPSTDIDNPCGLIFNRCRLEKQPGLEAGVIALGRPWHNAREAVGQTVYLRCWMDDHIDPVGWDRMAYGRDNDGEYIWMTPEMARLYEFDSRGPGGQGGPERKQLTRDQARFYEKRYALGDWKV